VAGRATASPKESKRGSLSLEERTRQRAHEIDLPCDFQPGSAVDDWLQAEAENSGGGKEG
jgi:Protein of unknown function (DUF2934)